MQRFVAFTSVRVIRERCDLAAESTARSGRLFGRNAEAGLRVVPRLGGQEEHTVAGNGTFNPKAAMTIVVTLTLAKQARCRRGIPSNPDQRRWR